MKKTAKKKRINWPFLLTVVGLSLVGFLVHLLGVLEEVPGRNLESSVVSLTDEADQADEMDEVDGTDEADGADQSDQVSDETNDKLPLPRRFLDLLETHWSAPFVERLADLTVVHGYPDGTFKPAQNINRAELTKMALRAFEVEFSETVEESFFPDVPVKEWFAVYVKKARELGIVEGYEDGTFRPAQSVNRIEALKIVLETSGLDLGSYQQFFKDVPAGSWMDKYIGFAAEKGIVEGYEGGVFKPGNAINRAEVSKIIIKILDLKDGVVQHGVDDGQDGGTVDGDGGGGEDEEDEVEEDQAEEDQAEAEEEAEEDQIEQDPCEDIFCPDYCLNDVRYYGGSCEDGECDYNTTECEFGCGDGLCKSDPCVGVDCVAQCDGMTREFDGQCADGECQYENEQCSYQCGGGVCMTDLCADVTCPDLCDGQKTLKHNGQCVEGECVYEEQTCDYICFEEACKVNPCDTMTCENMCTNDWLFYDRPCSEGWCLNIEYKYCDYGCEDGACLGDPCIDATCPDMCEGNTRKYSGDCTGGSCQYATETCAHGCTGGTCNADPCAGVNCPADYCDGETRRYGGFCLNGSCVYSGRETCHWGCEDGECNPADYCEGVVCPSYCSGLMAKNNGRCESGACRYDSDPCDWGCTEGVCDGDPCVGMSCPDFCAGTYWVFLGECDGGGCDYAGSQPCSFGCLDGVCRADPCDGVSCSDTCSGSTRKYDGECSGGVCQYESEACGYDCEAGECIADPCIGVSCPDYCAAPQLFKHDGECVDGACQYEDISCGFKCSDDYGFVACMDEPPMGTIFVTSTTRPGNFGGVDKADEYCQDSAGWAGISGSWIALVSDSRVQMKDRIPSSSYKRMDGEIIASSKEDLLDGSIAVPINMTEYGVEYDGMGSWVWTGTDEDGSLCESYLDSCYCHDWTASGEFNMARIGDLDETDAAWIANAYQECLQGYNHFYCMAVGQPIGTIFVTEEKWTGNFGGIEGADEKCQDAVVDPENFSGRWRALISAPGVNARDRIPDTLYKRVDGEVIAWGKEDLFDGDIENPINVTEYGDILDERGQGLVRTATLVDGTVCGGDTCTCEEWTVADSYTTAFGSYKLTNGDWIQMAYMACHEEMHLYCVKTDYVVID